MNSTQVTYNRLRNEIDGHADLIYWTLQLVTDELGFTWEQRRVLPAQIVTIIKNEAEEPLAAQKIWTLLGTKADVVAHKLEGRSQQIYSQIAQHLVGSKTILDFGCGDAKVAERMQKDSAHVMSYDIADYRSNKNLPFISDWKKLENQKFDAAVAVAVFHHCDFPEREIARLATITNRVIVIESVIDPTMPWAVQALIDWLYNRGMHPGAEIPVPGNFKTVENWIAAFAQENYHVVASEDIGIDLPIVPEHHHLFVLEKI